MMDRDLVRAELVWFMSHFDQLYAGMDSLGFVRQPLRAFTATLRSTPVQRPISDGTGTIPIVQVSKDGLLDGDEERHKLLASSEVLQYSYIRYTVFRAAFSTHCGADASL